VAPAERARLLRGASALAYPSLYEGFGLPPLEAMSAGVPVVTTDGGALPEVAGPASVVVPAGDAAALAGALEEVLTDEALRRRLVEKGRAHAAGFRWEASAEAMVALYRDAVASAGGRRRL
ncbi:MAG: glycosyltransferase, partial [Acidimicrobiales bacterium]